MQRKTDYFRLAQSLFERYSTMYTDLRLTELAKDIPESMLGGVSSNIEIRRLINSIVLAHYPNETTIKASFINEVILRQGHSNISIFELPVGQSRIDFCKINGSSSAYEIKTELDNFTRLEKQLYDYSEVFENVYLIIPAKREKTLPSYLTDRFGLYVYRQTKAGKYVYKLVNAPKKSETLNPVRQLSIVTKKVLCREAGCSEKHNRQEVVDHLLQKKSSVEINKLFKRYLKDRYCEKWLFFRENHPQLVELDYQWFYHNNLDPAIIYQTKY